LELIGEETMTTSTLNWIRNNCTAQTTIDTPLGRVLLVRSANGLAGAWFVGQKHFPGPLRAPETPKDPLLQRAARELREFFAGKRERFEVNLDLQGTPFQRSVWKRLLRIAAGTTRSYGEIAKDIGAAKAVRAVGSAVGRNPVSVIVPCHRVVGSDGSLTGYAGGIHRKQRLLELERAHA
jgi:methylated-DNA-[protein]-cysteine S-methyltransferase